MRQKQTLLAGLTVLFAAAMTACAQILGEPEILFPEAAALCAGAWMAPRQPWRVKRPQMVALMTASAAGGVLIVRVLPAPLTVKTLVGLLYTGALLTLSGSTLVPLISACILPIFLRTESWVYPAAVCLLTLCIAAGQWLLTRAGLRMDGEPAPAAALADRLRRWGSTMGMLALFVLLPTAIGRPYLCAPPLLVAFAEMLAPGSHLRRKPLTVWLLVSDAGAAGLGARLLHIRFGLPLVLCAALTVTVVLLLFRALDQMLPPAAAAGLLPLLLPEAGILLYLPLLALGAAVAVTVPRLVCRDETL